MKKRCANPKTKGFHNYGGRGIRVCDEWRASFQAFLRDMGHRPSSNHSIERNDNEGHYSPDNCRWALKIEQANNTRRQRRLTLRGDTRTMAQWARHLGLGPHVILKRLKRGWTVERALTDPPRIW